MTKKYELSSEDLMSASEASGRWGYDEGYVRQQLSKYPEKFKEGTIRKFGKTYIITREGMEYLTGMTEKEANSGLWVVRHEKNWIVDFEKRVDSEIEARNLIASKVAEETKEKNFKINFKELDIKSKKSCVRIKGNSIYTYEKAKK
ncbi:helix-turn-helix domain-containing protein [Enterococcus sp. AZ101]|uniref:helix-turn-helix domain-containing protein n=1 Tax=Enterococcus sp. AZ101 TaxID=2774742 RepID=UPI003D291269